MTDIQQLFPKTYEASRQRFLGRFEDIKKRWPDATQHQHRLAGSEDITIDWVNANANKKTEKILVLTTAEHGIEGYVGSAVLELFFMRYLERLDADTTDLMILHTINPWGMKHRRRTNAGNVDINRTFLWKAEERDPKFNPDYTILEKFLMPEGPVGNLLLEKVTFLIQLASYWIKLGMDRLNAAPLLGQYRYQKGIYFGGESPQEETQVLMDFYRQAFQKSSHVLHLDMHTGWGPRQRMTLIDSVYEPRSSQKVARDYKYPAVAAANPEEFYALRGDMIDWIYQLRDHEYPDTRLYSTSFEFGTYGHSLWQDIRGLRTMIFENRLHWHGAKNKSIEAQVKYDLNELFEPEALEWRVKAMADADEALKGILSGEGYI
jgi:hypothetical protein